MAAQDDIDTLTATVAEAAQLIAFQIEYTQRASLAVDPIDMTALSEAISPITSLDPNATVDASTTGDMGVGGQLSVNGGIYADTIYTPANNTATVDARIAMLEAGASSIPGRVAAQFFSTSTVSGAFSDTEDLVFEMWYPENTNRMYLLQASFFVQVTNITDRWSVKWRFIRGNGSYPAAPTVANTTAYSETTLGASTPYITLQCDTWTTLATGTTTGNFIRWGVSLIRNTGSGTSTIFTSSTVAVQGFVLDMGSKFSPIDGTDVTTQGQLIGGGSVPVPPGAQNYTATYVATWSNTYQQSGPARTDDGATHLYTGFQRSGDGNNLSLIGFNYTDIQAALAGAAVSSIIFSIFIGGIGINPVFATFIIGGHSYSSKPGSWSSGSISADHTSSSVSGGSYYNFQLPITPFGANFQSGAWKGILIGPGRTNDPVYFTQSNGATQLNPPSLTLHYSK